MRGKFTFIAFILGIVCTVLVLFSLKKCFSFSNKKESSDYYILTNQISKMNKMVVMEQNTSSLRKTKFNYEFLGSKISSNQIMTFTKTNAQVSYDLNKMKLEVDSIHKKLIIKELPEPEIKIIPSVEIQSLDDSFFNRISEKDIKNVTQKAKEQAVESINQEQLKTEGKKQLIENLNTIFVLAKALHYTIEDQTRQLDLSFL